MSDAAQTEATGQREGPLRGVRVLESAPASAGSVTRYLAELGADVICVEQPESDGNQLAALVANSGKRVFRQAPGNQGCRERLVSLAAHADIFVEARLNPANGPLFRPAELETIRARNTRLVILSLTPFGEGNAFEGWQATAAVVDALSGVLARSGFPNREPLLPPAGISLECAYVQAAWVAMLSYFNRLRTGLGDRIDLSLVEAGTQAIDPAYGIAGSATAGVPASQLPRGRPEARHQYPVLPCKDGFVRICVLAPRQWQGMFEWMGRPAKYAGSEFTKLQVRFRSHSLLPDIAAMFATKTRNELEAEAARYGVPIAHVQTLEEDLVSPQIRARHGLMELTAAEGRQLKIPNGVFEIDGERAGVGRGPEDLRAGDGWLPTERFDPEPSSNPPERPLSGYTVIDFGVIVAGAEQSRLLADQGALTLKVETAAFPDGGRQSLDGAPVSISFAMGHRNKKGLGINLRTEKGRSFLMQLVRRADVVMSNFKPGTLRSLGLHYTALRAVNPQIILAESSAYGSTGPMSGRPGYGPLVRANSGLTHQWAYPGSNGEFSDGMTTYPDHVSGRIMAISALALLVRRMRTDIGGATSLAQSEVITTHLSEQVAALSLGRKRRERVDAPWGVYRCAGDDEWCVITVRGDSEWLTLAGAIGREDLLNDTGLKHAEGRLARKAEIDEAVRDWTSLRAAAEVMTSLQTLGVPAAKMLRPFELPDSPFFRARNSFRDATHPLIEHGFKMENSIGFSERIKDPEFAPAPLPGEHSEWVARAILGLSDGEIEQLFVEGVLESGTKPVR